MKIAQILIRIKKYLFAKSSMEIVKIKKSKYKTAKTKKSFDEIDLDALRSALIKHNLDEILVVDTSDNEKYCIAALYKDFKTQKIVTHFGIGRIKF
jgi:hypothetical protein